MNIVAEVKLLSCTDIECLHELHGLPYSLPNRSRKHSLGIVLLKLTTRFSFLGYKDFYVARNFLILQNMQTTQTMWTRLLRVPTRNYMSPGLNLKYIP